MAEQDPIFKATLEVEGASEAVITEFAIKFLEERAYYVAAPDAKWEKPGEFCRRVRLFPHRIRETIERYEQRKGPPIRVDRRGQSGRIMAIQSNPHFDNFCRSRAKGPYKRKN